MTDGIYIIVDRIIQAIAGSYYTNGDRIGSETRIKANTTDDAQDMRAMIEGGLAFTEESMRTDEMESLIDQATVKQQGSTVVVTFENDVQTIVNALEVTIDEWEEVGSEYDRPPRPWYFTFTSG